MMLGMCVLACHLLDGNSRARLELGTPEAEGGPVAEEGEKQGDMSRRVTRVHALGATSGPPQRARAAGVERLTRNSGTRL